MAASAHLRRLRATINGPVELGPFAAGLGREGIGLLAVILSAPFLQPIPMAGLGTPVGILLAALGVQLASGRKTLALPRFVAARRLEAATVARVLAWAEKFLGLVERFTRPRWPAAARMPRTVGAAMAVLGAIFAIPIFVPFGNPLTAAAMLLLGLSLLEEDGLCAVLGLLMTAVTCVAHAVFFALLWKGGRALLR